MVLKSEIQGFDVEYKTGNKVGVVKDIVVDTTEERWRVVGIVVSPGIAKKEFVIKPDKDVTIDLDKETITISGEAEHDMAPEDASSEKKLKLEYIHKKKVCSKDDEKIGKIYDAVIMTRITPWSVWKVIIRVPGFIAMRVRLDIRDIESIDEDCITLKLTKDELEEITEAV